MKNIYSQFILNLIPHPSKGWSLNRGGVFFWRYGWALIERGA